MMLFRTSTCFAFLKQISYFCPHIAGCANIAECVNIAECANIAGIFWQKTFGDIRPCFLSD
jgi:hypothetical protein